MSHKASSWLADIPADLINAGAFRVLFHLCDAHNSKRPYATACFPSQELLRQVTGLSNGGLNNALNSIEGAGLMRRRRTRNPDGTKGPTYYILGCDVDLSIDPTPENGDGTISKLEAKPSPNSGLNHLHSTGDKPVIEPVKEPVIARKRANDLFSAENEADEKSKADEDLSQGFEEIWKAFPRKPNMPGKDVCKREYKRVLKKVSHAELMRAVRAYAKSRENEDPKFHSRLSKWLRDGNYEGFLTGPEYRWDDLRPAQQTALADGRCPPSMLENGEPNAVAAHWLAKMRRAS
ncbi:helix-turn-helix domain-containing protein [Tritonibacter mobilis]|uniref:hypothetical protein n=1 Tax=Tritonibacter mobilis TaxID=379347 RepID=UPI000806BF41|nr:hypothetical protein [Tritonibacter mobilis]